MERWHISMHSCDRADGVGQPAYHFFALYAMLVLLSARPPSRSQTDRILGSVVFPYCEREDYKNFFLI